jgi:hypothetical protein
MKAVSLHSRLLDIARASVPLSGAAGRLAFALNAGNLRPLTGGHLHLMNDDELSSVLEYIDTLPEDANIGLYLVKFFGW